MFNLSARERRAALMLSLVFGIRMVGLFMILPVFALYTAHFQGATPFLMGLALGIYGFSSSLAQVLLGMLSDRWGRKPIITLALLVFAVGSVLCGMSSSIEGLIAGRFLQGLGASGSSILALLSDLTLPESRTKAMATVGMTIGLSFVLSIAVGPTLNGWVGLPGLFDLTALLACVGIGLVWVAVPTPTRSSFHPDQEFSFATMKAAFRHGDTWRLNVGVFCLHAILMGVFVGLGTILSGTGFSLRSGANTLYFVTLILAFVSMMPLMIVAEKKGWVKGGVLFSIAALMAGVGLFALPSHSLMTVGVGLWVFFTGFVFLEASLPAWLSRICLLNARGTAFGLYSSSQFFGAFVGGAMSGFLLGHHSVTGVFLSLFALALFWFLIAITIAPPPRSLTRMLSLPLLNEGNRDAVLAAIRATPGVVDVTVGVQEKTAYVRVEKTQEAAFNASIEEIQQWQKEP